MLRITELRLPLDHAPGDLHRAVVARLGIADADLHGVAVFRRGVDARQRAAPKFVYTLDCSFADGFDQVALLARHAGDRHLATTPDMRWRPIARAPADFRASGQPRPLVVGFGPCGIFAALVLAQMGFAPLVLERGKAVRERTRDTWGLWRRGVLDPESNVQFGEGGAGTFSDGKLYSQISDARHLTRKVLEEFVAAGAPEEILWSSKPHIGTFRLVSMVEKLRARIVAAGGEIRFGARLADLRIEGGQVRGVTLADGEQIDATEVVLALGHSARDTFEMLHARGVPMQAKPFSVGLRIEHPQGLIDRARFGANAGHPALGAADYRLVHHASNRRSVYSFCMCPGGTVVAATSEPERVVTNGMSQYSRAERNANAAIVVGIAPEDCRQGRDGRSEVPALDGIAFQRRWESRAYELGGGGYVAPAELVGDFVAGRHGDALAHAFGTVLPTYRPGVQLTDLADPQRPSLPTDVLDAIREALPAFERSIPGFAMPDAVLTGVETRTSSPLRIPRGADCQCVGVAGLYPAGEGAGYAGGIMSAAVDGIEVAEAVAQRIALRPR